MMPSLRLGIGFIIRRGGNTPLSADKSTGPVLKKAGLSCAGGIAKPQRYGVWHVDRNGGNNAVIGSGDGERAHSSAFARKERRHPEKSDVKEEVATEWQDYAMPERVPKEE